MSELLTIPEVAALLRVKTGAVYQMRHKGLLRGIRFGHKSVRIPRESVEKFLEEHREIETTGEATLVGAGR